MSSTQLFATNLISNSRPPNGTVISTDFQEEGMGQSGRGWFSSANQNLLMSVIYYPEQLAVNKSFDYTMAISLAIVKTTEYILPESKTSIKWPNDIYVDDRKLAGTLLQSKIHNKQIQHLIIGIGININESSFPDHLPNPISMAQISGQWIVKETVYDFLIEQINYYFKLIEADKIEVLKQAYHDKLYGLHQEKYFFTKDKGKFLGTIRGVDEQGVLMIETASELLQFRQTELSYLVS